MTSSEPDRPATPDSGGRGVPEGMYEVGVAKTLPTRPVKNSPRPGLAPVADPSGPAGAGVQPGPAVRKSAGHRVPSSRVRPAPLSGPGKVAASVPGQGDEFAGPKTLPPRTPVVPVKRVETPGPTKTPEAPTVAPGPSLATGGPAVPAAPLPGLPPRRTTPVVVPLPSAPLTEKTEAAQGAFVDDVPAQGAGLDRSDVSVFGDVDGGVWDEPEAPSPRRRDLQVMDVDPVEDEPDDDPEVPEIRVGRQPKADKGPDAFALTERDRQIMAFLTRYRFATYAQLAVYFDTSEQALRRRLPRLRKAGLVKSEGRMHQMPKLWRPTDAGVKVSGLSMPTPTIPWGAIRHTLGLIDLGIRFEAEGEVVVTEREIRAADLRDRLTDRMEQARKYYPVHDSPQDDERRVPLFAAATGQAKNAYVHIPDIVLVRPPAADGSPQTAAIELELTRKAPKELRKIMRAFKAAPNIGVVVYYTHSTAIRNAIDAAATAEGVSDMVTVRKFVPTLESGLTIEDLKPAQGKTSTRGRG